MFSLGMRNLGYSETESSPASNEPLSDGAVACVATAGSVQTQIGFHGIITDSFQRPQAKPTRPQPIVESDGRWN